MNKPLIQYGVEAAQDAGLQHMVIVTDRGKRALEDHFDISYELEHQIYGTDKENFLNGTRELMETCTSSYIRQVAMKGLGHVILPGRPLIGDEPFAVVLADDLCLNRKGYGVLSPLLDPGHSGNTKRSDAQLRIIDGEQIRECIYRVNSIVEKPKPEDAPSNLAIIGRYILTADIFDLIADCAFHAIRPPSPPTSGHLFHAHPARQSERSDAGLHC